MKNIILCNWVGEKGLATAGESLTGDLQVLNALQAGIVLVEKDPTVPHVGLGGNPNMLGVLETDAAVMDGDTLRIGCVGALSGYESAVSVAREVYEHLPHTMLVGEGAKRFAAECGATPLASDLTVSTRAQYQDWLDKNLSAPAAETKLLDHAWPVDFKINTKDTVVYLGLNTKGQMAGATSTSGWDFKYPGRLGDSPIIGAGMYADSRYGAAACTHTGEMTMRAGTAHSVVHYLRQGADVESACLQAAQDLLYIKSGFTGPVVIHALDSAGNHHAVMVGSNTEKVDYFIWQAAQGISKHQAKNITA